MPALLLAAAAALLSPLQDPSAGGFRSLAAQVREHTLPNGLRVIVLPHGEAPVASFHLYVQTGAVDERNGQTGLAHFAEHMAFKGSSRIGATDWRREREALARADAAWTRYEDAATRTAQPDPAEVERLRAAFEEVRSEADDLVASGAFDRAVEEAGGLDQNAGTGADSTRYFVSLPVNRLEEYFWLTREQIGSPAMREFYRERDVVMEERRMRTDSSAFGALFEALINAAFVAHPYRDSTIGHMDDLKFLDRQEMIAFWQRHYTADRMILAVVGRVDPDRVFRLAGRYLSALPRGTEPRLRRTVEPLQKGERIVLVSRPAAPQVIAGWKIPAQHGRTRQVYEALSDILAGGPFSRLYTRLVKHDRLAADVSAFTGFPGGMDPCLLLVIVQPAPGRSPEKCIAAAQEEITRLGAEGPTAEEMAGVRRRAKMQLLRSLESNSGLAAALASAEAEDGGWESLFDSLEMLEDISAEELAGAAAGMAASQRTTGYLLPPGMRPGDEEEER